jgi:hypothetical protein
MPLRRSRVVILDEGDCLAWHAAGEARQVAATGGVELPVLRVGDGVVQSSLPVGGCRSSEQLTGVTPLAYV